MTSFELPINWRLAKNGFHCPKISFDNEMTFETKTTENAELQVLLLQNYHYDVLAIRNWLHDHDNCVTKYRLLGCFLIDNKHQTILTGIKVGFFQAIDMLNFRLFCSTL